MTKPSIKVGVAFQDNPLATPTWTDVTADWRGEITIRRGRATERDRIEAGTASLTLDNRTRRYDPNNTSSTYYPYVLPVRPIKIEAAFGGITYPLFRGFVGGWTPVEPGGQDALVRLQCVDGFEYFASAQIASISRPAEDGGARIWAVLDVLGWPTADRTLVTGQTTLQSYALGSMTPLSHMQDVALTENGLLFMDPAGRVEFQDRHYRLRNGSAVATFGRAGGSELPFLDISITNDKSQVFNDIQVSYPGGSTATSSDTTSQARYFRRTLTRSILVQTISEAQDCADWLRLRCSTAQARIERLVVSGHLNDAIWPHQLGRDISDVVAATHRPPGGGAAISGSYYIESIEHRIADQCATFTTTWQLSTVTGLAFLTLDDPVLGRLDSNALAY